MKPLPPTGALAELRQAEFLDQPLGASGEWTGAQPLDPQPALPPTIREVMSADPVDWYAEEALRLEQDRLERAKTLAAEVERIAPEDEQPRPARPRAANPNRVAALVACDWQRRMP